MSKLFNPLLLALALAVAAPAALADESGHAPDPKPALAPPPVSSGSCTAMTLVEHKEDSSTMASTTSTSYVTVPGTAFSFTQTTAGCAIVTFSAESWAPGGNKLIHLEAVMDGGAREAIGDPGDIQFSGDDDENNNQHWARSRAFTFVFSSVSAGAHALYIKWRSDTVGGKVYLGKHSVVLVHS